MHGVLRKPRNRPCTPWLRRHTRAEASAMKVRQAAVAVVALSLLAAFPAKACSGCGCRGGPGYRGPNGRCVGWSDIGRTCGAPPTTHCTPEGPNAGAEEAAKLGVKAIEAGKPKADSPK